MEYIQQLEKQNEELKDRLAAMEQKFAELEKPVDVKQLDELCDKHQCTLNFVLDELANILLDKTCGLLSGDNDAIIYSINVPNAVNSDNIKVSMVLRKTQVTLLGKTLQRKKPKEFVHVLFEEPYVSGCLTSTRIFDQITIDKFKKAHHKLIWNRMQRKNNAVIDCIQKVINYIKKWS